MNKSLLEQSIRNIYATYDLGLAAALVTLNYPLIRLDKANRNKVCFVFKYGKYLDANVARYWGNDLNLPARGFFDNQKMLKSRIHSI